MISIVKKIGIATCCTLMSFQGWAYVDVELNPGYIEGQVRMGDTDFIDGRVRADSGIHSANILLDTSAQGYALTVQVEKGGSERYRVHFSGRLESGYHINFAYQYVDVEDGQTTQVDYGHDNPATLKGDVIVPDNFPYTINNILIKWKTPDANVLTGYSDSTTSYSAPLLPGDSFAGDFFISLHDPESGVNFDTRQSFTLSNIEAGQTYIKDIVLTDEELNLGKYTFDLTYSGDKRVHYFSCGNASGRLNADENNRATFASGPVVAGNKYLDCFVSFFGGSSINIPPKYYSTNRNGFSINPAETTHVVVDVEQAYVEGKILLSGSVSNQNINTLTPRRGITLDGGFNQSDARSTLHANGEFTAVVTPDNWVHEYFDLPLKATQDSPDFFNGQTIQLLAETPSQQDEPIAAGDTRVLEDIPLHTGSVRVKFRVSDGSLLSYPKLRASKPCETKLGFTYGFNTPGTPQQDVAEGYATFVGPAATCRDIQAWATVNGSQTTFGQFDVNVVPGVEQVIDIDGPRITLDIAPGTVFNSQLILVTGTATDNNTVTSVQVNGLEASLVSTSNPDDPNEVRFEVEVPLQPGTNTLQTTAFDDSDNSSSDSRDVEYQLAGPQVQINGPTAGEEIAHANGDFAVFGSIVSATDIASATINGVPFTPFVLDDGYGFSESVSPEQCPQYPCEMTVSVEVADESGGQGQQSITVTLVDQVTAVRICDANEDGHVDKRDISEIFKARNIAAVDDDPRDYDANGVINVVDARGCQAECDLARCAIKD